MKLKHIGVWSVVRIAAILYAIVGLIIGSIVAVMAVLGMAIGKATGAEGAGPFGVFFGVGAIVFMPAFYAVLGAVGATLGTWLYNVIARAMGGIELDLEP